MRHKYLLITLLLTLFFVAQVRATDGEVPMVEEGVIDLSSWDFSSDGSIYLNGDWEFYWNVFLMDKPDISYYEYQKSLLYVPKIWNNHERVELTNSSKGFASYRLKVKVPDKQKLAIKYINSATSCEIFIDGESYYKSGNPGKSENATTPSYKPHMFTFTPSNEEFEIVLQIANYHHKKGGQWEPILLGNESSMTRYYNVRYFTELILIGCIFIMSVFHFIMYQRRENEQPTLYFALFTLLITVRLLVTGEFTLYMLGDINWGFMIRADYLSFYLLVLAFVHFVKSLYPREVSHYVSMIGGFLVALFVSSVIIFPSKIFSHGMIYFQALTILAGIYAFRVIYNILKNKREGRYQFALGFIILFVCLIHDVLKENTVFNALSLTPYGLAIFIIMQASVLSSRIRNALVNNKILSGELSLQNADFSRLNNRYKAQNEQLTFAKEKAEQSDQFKSAFLANMSHEIRTPMNGIVGFSELLRQDDFTKVEREEFIGIINERSKQLLGIVNDIIDITKIETGQIDVHRSNIYVNELMDELFRSYQSMAKNKGIKFSSHNELSMQESYTLTDSVKLQQILDNLISNAIKFTNSGGVDFGYVVKRNFLEFYVRDSGIGISKVEEEVVFGRFNQANHNIAVNYGGTGLGLPIAKAYAEKLGGELWIESKKGVGSTFYFTLPFNQ